MSKFKIGDSVQLTTRNPVRGKGALDYSDLQAGNFPVGVVTGFDPRDEDVIVNFPDHSRFYAPERELKLFVEEPAELVLGDRVVATSNRWAPEVTKDEVLTVVADGVNPDFYAVNGQIEISFAKVQLERGNVERAAPVPTQATEETLELGGEYIVTDRKEPSIHAFANGTKVKVIALPTPHSNNADAVAVDGKHEGVSQYVPVTDLARVEAQKAPVAEAPKAEVAFKAGDKVRLIVDADDEPKFGWGEVSPGDEGVISHIDSDGDLIVNFPAQYGWIADSKELVLVGAAAPAKAPVERADRTEDPVYAVVHESRQGDFLLVTGDREEARAYKARKGGKRAGYIINLYTKAKEIR